MRIAYRKVCPNSIEVAFLESYNRGEKARFLEIENQKLATKIEQIAQQITNQRTISSVQKDELSTQIEDLKKMRADNERKLSLIVR